MPEPTQTSEEPKTPPATEEETLLTYEYQPTDEAGRPMGGKQVIKGKTQQELLDNMASNNNRMQAELRKARRDLVLEDPAAAATRGNAQDIPADAERVNWKEFDDPKPLTADQRMQLSRDLNDPEKVEAAQEQLLKASPTYREMHRNSLLQRAMAEGKAFADAHPEFYPIDENRKALVSWCVVRELALTKKNFEIAFKKLSEAGLLVEAPEVAGKDEPPANGPETEDERGGITPETERQPQPARTGPSSSGLHRGNSNSNRGAAPIKKLTWADVDKMSAPEYDKKVRSDAGFRKAVDALPPRGAPPK